MLQLRKNRAIRVIVFALLLTMIGWLIPGNMQEAEAHRATDIKWTEGVVGGAIYFDTETGEITDCDYSVTEVTIPESIQGVTVASIGGDAFWHCRNLTNITIPNSVTSIGDNAFGDCSSLTNITIPNSVTSIGYGAFSGCSSLTNITIPNSVTRISDSTFRGCSSLTNITIPNSVTDIGNSAFSGCNSLTNITIPNSVTSIGDNAFAHCWSLTDITIPDGVTWISDATFFDCISLINITIPNGVDGIGDIAFAACKSLESISVGDGNQYYASISGVLFNKTKTSLIQYPLGNKRTSYDVPYGVECIEREAFVGCDNLTNLAFPDSVVNIGNSAIRCCRSLTSITVGEGNESYTSINGVLFNKAETSLIQYPPGSKRTSYDVPDRVTWIGGYAFALCSNLTNITLPDSIEGAGERAFYECENLTRMMIPDGIESITDWMFFGCGNMTSITIPDSVEGIGEGAFYDCRSLTNIVLPDRVTSIGDEAFLGCENITSITIPDRVTGIGDRAFYGCSNLTTVTLSASMTSIGEEMFKSCSNLTSITIPNSVISIGWFAFDACENLTIYGYQDSYAETYAKENDIPFKIIGGGSGDSGEDYKPNKFSADIKIKINNNKTYNQTETWDDAYFGADAMAYNHDLATLSMAFAGAAYDYNNASASLDNMRFSNSKFYYYDSNAANVEVSKKLDSKADTTGFSLSYKTISVGGKAKKLVCVLISGTRGDEWYSNMNFRNKADSEYDAAYATGFHKSSKRVMSYLNKYIAKTLPDVKAEDIRFLVTGHSRGAAVANLVGAALNDSGNYSKSHIYTYTFATPNVSTKAKYGGYENIFNVCNPEDFVTKIPLRDWGYKRFGKTIDLPSKKNTSSYKSILATVKQKYQAMTSEKYDAFADSGNRTDRFSKDIYKAARSADEALTKKNIFKPCYSPLLGSAAYAFTEKTTIQYFNMLADYLSSSKTAGEKLALMRDFGVNFKTMESEYQPITEYLITYNVLTDKLPFINGSLFGAHSQPTYYSWMKKLTASQLKACNSGIHLVENKCPTDINVYDSQRTLVASVIDNKVEKEDVPVSVEGETKKIYLPGDEEYNVVIMAREQGKMDYDVSELDAEGNIIRKIRTTDIEIRKDDEFAGNIAAGTEESAQSFALVENEEQTIAPEEELTGDQVNNIKIDVDSEGNGNATGSAIATRGDSIVLAATPAENEDFLGWYTGNTKLSSEANYSFSAEESKSIVGKFTNHLAEKDITVSFDSNGGSAIKAQTFKGGNSALEPDSPKKAYCTFQGWYLDKDFKTEYDFSCIPIGDIQLYAKWSNDRIDVKTCEVSFDKTKCVYNGSVQKPKPIVKAEGKLLVETKDYNLSYSNNVNAGTAKMVVQGIGNYTGAVEKQFIIAKADQNISARSMSKAYGGNPFYLGAKGQGSLSYWSSNTKVATINSAGKVTMKGTGTATVTIAAAATQNYNAAVKSIIITVTPKKVSGLKTKASKNQLTVSWKKDMKVSGYQIVCAQNKTFKKGKKTVTISKNRTAKKTIKKLKSKKTYYVKVRGYKKVGGKKLYGAYSSVKKVRIK